MTLLEIKNLTVTFPSETGELEAVKDVNLTLGQGEFLALVGESGCGKTVLCKSMLQLLCSRGDVKNGEALLSGRDLISLKEKDMEQLRGKEVSMIFQDPMTSLNPSIPIGKQIEEVMIIHDKLSKDKAKEKAIELLGLVGIDYPEIRYRQPPHEFSGGMRQRVAIAIALAGNPKVLLADEPTTSLDEKTQVQILKLLKDIQMKTNVSIIFITHDLGLVEEYAERVIVMLDGEIVEEGTVEQIFESPNHEYTKRLMRYVNYGRGKEHTHGKHEESQFETLLSVKNLSMEFSINKHKKIRPLNNFNLEIGKSEILGISGPSGCGKSTLAKCIMGVYRPTEGEVIYLGNNKQMIFQDSMAAFNSRMSIGEVIAEPLFIQGVKSKSEIKSIVKDLMNKVELSESLFDKHPYEVSGGQRQRAAIARAISLKPDLLIADEPIASLDVSIQAQIVHLFEKLREEEGLAIILIAHDLPMVQHVSDRIIYMKNA